jgi:hypothetical protein
VQNPATSRHRQEDWQQGAESIYPSLHKYNIGKQINQNTDITRHGIENCEEDVGVGSFCFVLSTQKIYA